MLTYDEKITIINERIDRLQEIFTLTKQYVDLINSGMADPDINLEQCDDRIKDISLKIKALKTEKTLLS